MLFAADSLISLRLAVGGRLHLYRLPMLYRHIITMFVGAATTTMDALPSLCWRMLCRPWCARSGGYFAALTTTLADVFAAMFALLIGRLRRMLCRCGATSYGGCLATL